MKTIGIVFFSCLVLGADARLVPAVLFSDNMVLQRDRPVPVWGSCEARTSVTVDFAGVKASTVSADDGSWRVDMPPLPACGVGALLTITTAKGEEVVIRNVVVGEVWLCGGQSNMVMGMWPKPQVGPNAGRERNGYFDVMLTNEPEIRGVSVPFAWSEMPCEGKPLDWFPFKPGQGGDFSAVAWHFAMRLHAALRVPVGVIACAKGGSCIEPWIPPEGYSISERFKDLATRPVRTAMTAEEIAGVKKGVYPSLHQQPRACWNAMVHPLAPYGIRGVIWYQGCSNRTRWRDYYEMLTMLRAGWSTRFECEDLPFFCCQIAPYGYDKSETDDPGLSQIREEIERFGNTNGPHVGAAILADVGETDNIHPGDKRTVSTRLAALVLNRIYGFSELKCDAPRLKTVETIDAGRKFVLRFDHVESWVMNGQYVPRFEIGDIKGRYVAVKCEIVPGTNRIVLTVPNGVAPTSIAYMRKSCVHGFLKNEAGIPLGPFRKEL